MQTVQRYRRSSCEYNLGMAPGRQTSEGMEQYLRAETKVWESVGVIPPEQRVVGRRVTLQTDISIRWMAQTPSSELAFLMWDSANYLLLTNLWSEPLQK